MYRSKKFLAVLVITLVLVFAMSFAFVGCTSQPATDTYAPQTETTVETTTEPSATETTVETTTGPSATETTVEGTTTESTSG